MLYPSVQCPSLNMHSPLRTWGLAVVVALIAMDVYGTMGLTAKPGLWCTGC